MAQTTRLGTIAAGCIILLGGCLLAVDLFVYNGLWLDMGRMLGRCINQDVRVRTACYEDHIASLYPKHAVTDLFSSMVFVQKFDPAMVDCHFIAHRLGEAVTYADPSSWSRNIIAEGGNSLCAFGYVHGVTVAAFKSGPLSADELEEELPKFKKACVGADISQRQQENCHHGIGHMLYYVTGTHITKALELCEEVVPEEVKRSNVGRKRCYAGVLMNVFQGFIRTNEEESNPFNLSKETSRPFCEALGDDSFVGACLRQSWPLYSTEIIEKNGIESFCENQPSREETEWCFAKVFKGITWYLINDLKRVQHICQAVSPEWQKSCFSNASQEIIEEGGGARASVRRAVAFCDEAGTSISKDCAGQLLRQAGYFSEKGSAARSSYCSQLPLQQNESCLEMAHQ